MASDPTKPNILVIMGDDIGWFNIGAYKEIARVFKTAAFIATLGLCMSAFIAPAGAQVAGTSTLGVSVTELNLVAQGWRASKIIGAPVYNGDKKQVGKVADLIITPGRMVSYVIVSVGGFLGLGAKDVAVSSNRFKGNEGRLVLPGATKQALESLPAFHYSH
jgi:hypothetical protein